MVYFITDSVADLSAETIEEFGITVVPTPVVIDGTRYLDGETLSPDELFRIMGDGQHTIETHHATPATFEEVFLPFAKEGKAVICLCMSSGIGNNYDAAKIAQYSVEEVYPDFDLTIINTKCASAGYGLMVYKLAQMQRQGADKEQLLKAADFYVNHIRHSFVITRLQYFMKNGRIEKGIAQIGDSLDLKPVMHVDEEGSLQLQIPMHGTQKALDYMVERAEKTGVSFHDQTIAFCYWDDQADLDYIVNAVKERLAPASIRISKIGCAIGAHSGSGIIGMCYLDADDSDFRLGNG
ncbi:MAG: DegV family protein [Lachnospiraceae bacterium]|nr:DegV family protein [Lachnospiraceae bacterium]